MLSKDDVDRMVRDAQDHADEDRQRREEVETRNQAEALTFQAERTLRDLGDKVSSEDKADVESKISAVRDALKGDDLDALRSKTDAVIAASQKFAETLYQKAQSEGSASPNGAGGDDDVVDAEVVDDQASA
jgi:molecular chaperone DnaK